MENNNQQSELLTLNMYQYLAMRTATGYNNSEEMLLNALMGLAGEVGEAIDLLKKVMFQGHPMSQETYTKLVEEAGDILWYNQLVASALQLPLQYIAECNIQKTMKRYPEGFTPQASMERVDEKPLRKPRNRGGKRKGGQDNAPKNNPTGN